MVQLMLVYHLQPLIESLEGMVHRRKTTYKKYRQLKLVMDALSDQYNRVTLSFTWQRKLITGTLNGSAADWMFESRSPAFLKTVPSGRLNKYALWIGAVPGNISHLYNSLSEAALRAGYNLSEKEELLQ